MSTAERSEVHFGNTRIPYTVTRSARRKTVAVTVDPFGSVQLRAPTDTPLARLDTVVHRKALWILERRRRQEDLPPPPSPREFVSGETFWYLGRQYRLKVACGEADPDRPVRLIGRYLHIRAPKGTKADPRAALVAWYRHHALERLPERVAHWAPIPGLQPGRVLIRAQRRRWGSADAAGNLRFNWRIIQAPMRLVDYVVAHELVHLRHADHAAEFWAMLGRAMPDYEGRREALRALGRVMVW